MKAVNSQSPASRKKVDFLLLGLCFNALLLIFPAQVRTKRGDVLKKSDSWQDSHLEDKIKRNPE